MKNLSSKFKKTKKNILNSNLLKISIFLFCVFFVFLLKNIYYKPNLGSFVGSGIDKSGNVYVLGAKDESHYKVTKINKKGIIEFEKTLESKIDNYLYNYRNITTDPQGNFFLIKEMRDYEEIVSELSLQNIVKESVVMFDAHGNLIKTLAELDFSETSNKHTSGYIRKTQIVDQKFSVINITDNVVSVNSRNLSSQEELKKETSFEYLSPLVFNENPGLWINDICVLSSGKVFYSTKDGDLFFNDNSGNSVNCKLLLNKNNSSVSGISIDQDDNIYFTDLFDGTFYKLDSKSMNLSAVYNLWSSVMGEIRIKDLRKITAVDRDDFYAPSKNFNKPFYVRFGSKEFVIDKIRYSMFSKDFLFTVLICVIFSALVLLAIEIIKRFSFSKIKILTRTTLMFLPPFISVMLFLVFIITNYLSKDYKNVFKNYQNMEVTIISENIDGDEIENISNNFDYSSQEYFNLKSKINTICEDLRNKIGDKSDYAVIYAINGNKIYSIVSSKYFPSNSESKERLKFTDPDMITLEFVLSDCLLEEHEMKNLKGVSEKLASGEKVCFYEFDDIYGKIVGCFAPIKNSEKKLVGFVGNYFDESVHLKDETNKIFIKFLSLIGIISLMVILYFYFAIKFLLSPLEKLREGINYFVKGNRKTKIKINSNDEIQDLSVAFNDMTENIENFTNDLVTVNKQYLRFIPKELLNLLDKESIMEVKLNDNKETYLPFVYITFNIDCAEFENSKEMHDILFGIISKLFINLFKIIEDNGGIVQNFSGLNATILFSGELINALNSVNQISEMKIDRRIKQNIRMILGCGSILLGVIGSEARCGVSAISDELLRLIEIDAHMQNLGIKNVATESFISKIPEDIKENCRLLGKCTDSKTNRDYNIYELIDSYGFRRKNMFMKTKKVFENAINEYYNKNFKNARKLFSDVIKIDEKDRVSIYYLNKCDIFINNNQNKNQYILDNFSKNLF
ncbi:MAG: HAMP domain-containing protein [Candidatus Improbicoccus pseudotrichonymphae]|uniref:histidine kinase n=1 Tax=Candidatus Improbicoccus pseudotrichonymphae TaxID=3033792 RepID=A0AA48HVT3_9FIRM|nr:MAG: HAMP domain-containing protein [Candidatus Improbicoccus pseudotrichonymphae]